MTNKIITKLGCPDCENEFTIEGKFDENSDDIITCPVCSLKLSKWCYGFIQEEDNEKSFCCRKI